MKCKECTQYFHSRGKVGADGIYREGGLYLVFSLFFKHIMNIFHSRRRGRLHLPGRRTIVFCTVCPLKNVQQKFIIIIHFTVDGGLASWSAYGRCSAECGPGVQQRTRSCTNPSPQHGGDGCVGSILETQSCEVKPCPGTEILVYFNGISLYSRKVILKNL